MWYHYCELHYDGLLTEGWNLNFDGFGLFVPNCTEKLSLFTE